MDDVSLRPLLLGEGGLDREALFLERHYENQYVVGDWKLIAYWSSKCELYNLEDGPSEALDIASEHSAKVEELSKPLVERRAHTGLRPESSHRQE